MANNLKNEKKTAVVKALVEGCSIRSIARMTGVHKATILRLLVRVGKHCDELSNQHLCDLDLESIQADEIWTFIGKKQRHVTANDPPEYGDQYCFIAMDERTKLVPSWLLGKRTDACTHDFIADLACRVRGRIHLSTDGWAAYPDAVHSYLAGRVDYGQLIKYYGKQDDERRYSPPRITAIRWFGVEGFPDHRKMCTSHVERQNLTVRMQLRRFTRLTNAFSKKWENLRAALSLHFAHYNFCRIHRTISCTPAMAAGITGSIWSLDKLIP